MSQALTSSGVGARPTPYFGAWAKSAAAAKASNSALHIAHTSVGGDFPDRDAVVVILRIGAAGLDQRLAGGLHVAGFVAAAGLQAGLLPVPFPGDAEACEGHAQAGFVEDGVLPGVARRRRHLDPVGTARAGPRPARGP